MKRLLLIFALLAALFVPSITVIGNAAAVDILPNCGKNSVGITPGICQDAQNPGTTNPVIHILKVTIEVISLIIGVAAVIGIVLSGLRMILANGDSSSIASARSSLLYCFVGIAVAVLAQTIVVFVLDRIK